MAAPDPLDHALREQRTRLPPNVAVLGVVALLMGASSAMIYGVLPVFLVTVLGVSMTSIGVIEGVAEATTSFMKIASGYFSDRLGRRKPLVVLGYALSAISKIAFPLAESATAVLGARIADRVGKGVRDAPRDAFQTDITPSARRGAGFGLRLALYTVGAVIGPLSAIALMNLSGNDFRLVFWVALIPGAASIAVILIFLSEPTGSAGVKDDGRPPVRIRDLAWLPTRFWWVILVTSLIALARFSPAFLVLKTHAVGAETAQTPFILVIMYLVYSASAYPSGLLVDRSNRYLQLAGGIMLLIGADLVLAFAGSIWMTALGAALWGLQMGVTQGMLSTLVGDNALQHLRGTAFGLFDVAIGLATFAASAGAGLLWAIGGPMLTFSAGASVASLALVILTLRPAMVARVG